MKKTHQIKPLKVNYSLLKYTKSKYWITVNSGTFKKPCRLLRKAVGTLGCMEDADLTSLLNSGGMDCEQKK